MGQINMGLIAGLGSFLLILLALVIFFLLRAMRRNDVEMKRRLDEGRDSNSLQMNQMMQATASLEGRLRQMAENNTKTQAEFSRTLEERLDKVSQRMGDGLEKTTKNTSDSLSELKSRLAVIDEAQKNITALSGQMVGLQDILSNKQARGAFGEIQLNDLVSQILPPSAYGFQVQMSNGKRADCLIKLPNPPGSIVVDAKFPLESYHALQNAGNDTEKMAAKRSFSSDILNHVKAISEKYIINGETAESALMFLPSEAVYAELHANFPDVVTKSYRARVWIVSPTTLMATLNTVRAVLKDARMREQAHVIQKEIVTMMQDVGRLDDRVGKLKTHFVQASKDIDLITTSTGKITSRAEKIEGLQLEEADNVTAVLEPSSAQLELD